MVRENKGKEEHCEKHSIFAQGCFVYDLVFIDGIKEKLLSIAIIVAISSGSLHSTSGFDQGLNARNELHVDYKQCYKYRCVSIPCLTS